jgi:hypothetical protein
MILMDKQHQDPKFTAEKVEASMKQLKTRKAKKYLFFDVQTGALVFEYGGVSDNTTPMRFKDATGGTRDTKIYKLGLEVKEIRENDFYPELIIHVTGDYLNEELKKE